MLIENLVIYTRPPFEDSEGRKILYGYPVPYSGDHYLSQINAGYDKKDSGALRFEYENPVFNGLELVSENRKFGGSKNHQVLFPSGLDNHYIQYDIKNDVINDTMLLEKIEKGKLDGDFTFVKNGSHIELSLIGSKDYFKHKEQSEKQEPTKLLNKDLKIGYGYSTSKGQVEIFLGTFYENDYKMVGGSKLVEQTPTKVYYFVVISENGTRQFITKKTQRFTKETESQLISEEQARQIMEDNKVSIKKEMKSILKDISNVYTKHYLAFVEDATPKKKEWYIINAKEEARKLVNRAYELYRQHIVSADKSLVNYDKDYIHILVYNRLNESLEEAKKLKFI